ncbi:FAD-binding oxidoreductase [Bordetella sp. N]|uniref:FAD-binding oxidoreductase n=1 Tax=Bordetella sp. N TaxID=1746199 RepID=UPI0007092A86|nr:FAD-binding oxidoreductase [Bordetella sp. N]ALM85290.1 FAD-linked oxidase [Bordetella sp. N]
MGQRLSWGRYPPRPQTASAVAWPDDLPPLLVGRAPASTLPYGCGRSYGDSCLADSDHVIAMRGLDRWIDADWNAGIIRAQAGLTLSDVIDVSLRRGWFPPVTPGTKFVTLGGAIANDVHGKNHHVQGTFGQHVVEFTLLRSDGRLLTCSPDENPDLFAATIGGLGLTGIIQTVTLRLRPVRSGLVAQRSIRFGNLHEFFELSEEHDAAHEYTVAWVDCLASGSRLGRGHYIMGDHSVRGPRRAAAPGRLSMPVDPPFSLINRLSLRCFNSLYYHRQRKPDEKRIVGYDPFFYPLDKLLHWNRMYGRRGFQQYQCVIPQANAEPAIAEILKSIAASGMGSFLAVLKQCGSVQSPGLMSFPLHGASLALDFAQREPAISRLFATLDKVVHEAGGRLYPAKDAHMSAAHFRAAYPAWQQVEALRDPALMSQFWKRVAL